MSDQWINLVEADWLEVNRHGSDISILDASAYPKELERDGYEEFKITHIPGAQYFNVNKIADKETLLPQMLPSATEFQGAVRSLGINSADTIVIYDAMGLVTAPRVWWMFRVMGHEKVYVLNGGLRHWCSRGYQVVGGEEKKETGDFISHINPSLVWKLSDMRANVRHRTHQIVDARPAGSFEGGRSLHNVGLRLGHIPGSRNVPYTMLSDPETGRIKPKDQLLRIFEDSKVDILDPVVCTCGSGITACILALCLNELGNRDVPVYDGSWTEWGSQSDTPVETGSSR